MTKDYCVFCGSSYALVSMGNIQAKISACKECIDLLYKAKPGDFLYISFQHDNGIIIREKWPNNTT